MNQPEEFNKPDDLEPALDQLGAVYRTQGFPGDLGDLVCDNSVEMTSSGKLASKPSAKRNSIQEARTWYIAFSVAAVLLISVTLLFVFMVRLSGLRTQELVDQPPRVAPSISTAVAPKRPATSTTALGPRVFPVLTTANRRDLLPASAKRISVNRPPSDKKTAAKPPAIAKAPRALLSSRKKPREVIPKLRTKTPILARAFKSRTQNKNRASLAKSTRTLRTYPDGKTSTLGESFSQRIRRQMSLDTSTLSFSRSSHREM